MSKPRAVTYPLLFAVAFAMPLTLIMPLHAQTSGGTSGGISGGSPSTSPGATKSSGTSPGPAAIPGQSGTSTAAPSSDTIGNERTPSATTRQDTYDRLPDEPGPDYSITPGDPLDDNPAAAAGSQNEFPAARSDDAGALESEMVPETERATRGGIPTGQPQADARTREIRKEKERTAVDTLGECMEAWDPETHISKDDWKETCARTLDEPHL
jgi:hypothetical protein